MEYKIAILEMSETSKNPKAPKLFNEFKPNPKKRSVQTLANKQLYPPGGRDRVKDLVRLERSKQFYPSCFEEGGGSDPSDAPLILIVFEEGLVERPRGSFHRDVCKLSEHSLKGPCKGAPDGLPSLTHVIGQTQYVLCH